MSTIPIGSTDSARRAQAVIVVDRATGEPAAAGGGAGTSNTTEATQLLVKTAVETIATDGATADGQAAIVAAIGAIPTPSAGTEYAEDAPLPANPQGSAVMLRRRDTLTDAEVSADGDAIAWNATAKGEARVSDAAVLAELSKAVTELPPRPLRTDAASFPTRTQIEQSGADTDPLLAAGGAGVRQFVYYGWLQTDIATVITFKSGTTEIAKPITLAAGDMLVIGAPNAELPELYTADDEALNVTKSTAATLKGVLFSKAV